MDESTQRIKYEPKRKVRRGSEKRDQETSEASRSNQNMDSICRNQRQIDSHGKTKTDRDGKLRFEISGLISNMSVLLFNLLQGRIGE